MTQAKLAERLCVSRGLISQWEIAIAIPTAEHLLKLADILGATVDYILGRSDDEQGKRIEPLQRIDQGDLRAVPVIGTIPAGTPMLIMEDNHEYLYLPSYLLPQGDLYVLHVSGDSMCGEDVKICDGDLAIIGKDLEVNERDICAVQVNGNEVTLKRVHFHDGWIDLLPENKTYKPMIEREDDVKIIGKLLWTMQKRW